MYVKSGSKRFRLGVMLGFKDKGKDAYMKYPPIGFIFLAGRCGSGKCGLPTSGKAASEACLPSFVMIYVKGNERLQDDRTAAWQL